MSAMAKPILDPKKWSRDDYRLLVVLLLTVVYPIFVLSFFGLYVFTLLPVLVSSSYTLREAHHDGWYHYYWLVMAIFWLLLCAIILPCFRDNTKKMEQIIIMEERGTLEYGTKDAAVQPHLQVEETNNKKRCSIISIKSRNSSSSIEKEVIVEKSEKESLEKSCSSLERKKLTQSGEFLNEFIDSIESEELKKKEADCDVHAEEKEDPEKKVESGTDDVKENEKKDKPTQDIPDKVDTLSEDSSGSEIDEPLVAPEKKTEKLLNATQGQIVEGETVPKSDDELGELVDGAPKMRKKARPTVDTSRTSEYYECSMPTPKSADAKRPESNVVFLFVNPEQAATQEDVIVEHAGEVVGAAPVKTE